MAYGITENCSACGLCLPVCPNHAIMPALRGVRILAWLCTECVGYADRPQCADTCPEGAIVETAAPPESLSAG